MLTCAACVEKRLYAKYFFAAEKIDTACLLGSKDSYLTGCVQGTLFSAVEFVLKTDNVCFDNLLEVKKGGFICGD